MSKRTAEDVAADMRRTRSGSKVNKADAWILVEEIDRLNGLLASFSTVEAVAPDLSEDTAKALLARILDNGYLLTLPKRRLSFSASNGSIDLTEEEHDYLIALHKETHDG